MKKTYYLIAGILPLTLLLSSYSGDSKYGGGSPGGYTGSPGDAKTCVQCHGGTASAVTGWITSNVPSGGYIPGTTYTMTVTITGTGKKGFEVSPQTPSGALVGTLTAGSGTHLVNANKAVTQSSSSTANPYTKTFTWTAPVAGTGDVTFYGAFTLNKPVTKLCTLVIPENTTGIDETEYDHFLVSPNPISDHVQVNFFMSAKGIMEIRLIDISGRNGVYLLNDELPAGTYHQSLQIPSGLKKGVYILIFQQDTKRHQEKVIIR